MFCKNCGANIADGEVFCPECGTKQDAAAQQSAYAAPVAPAADNTATAAKGGDKKKFVMIGAIVAAVVLILVLIFSLGGGKGKERDFVLYNKDGNLWIHYISDNAHKKVSSKGATDVTYCEANGYLFFVEDTDGSEGTLCYINTKAKLDNRKAEKIVKGVACAYDDSTNYYVSNDGKTIYYLTADDKLYVHDFNDKQKIDGDVYSLLRDKNGKLFAYLKQVLDEGEATYELYSVDKKNNKANVLKDIEDFCRAYDEDGNVRGILVYADDTVSMYEDGKLKTLKSGLSFDDEEQVNFFRVDDNNNFYYEVTTAGDSLDLEDIITDSKKESDASITAPDTNDRKYWKNPDAYSSWDAELNDEYIKDRKIYQEKVLRDKIREFVEDGFEIDGLSNTEIFYFDGKEATSVLTNVEHRIFYGDILYYEKAETSEDATVDIAAIASKVIKEDYAESEFGISSTYGTSRYSVSTYVSELLVTGITKGVLIDNTPCAIKTVTSETDEDELSAFNRMRVSVDPEGSAVYFLYDYDADEKCSTLYKMKIKSKALGEAEKVYEKVVDYSIDEDSNLYTTRNPELDKDDNIETVTLYVGDKEIAKDIPNIATYIGDEAGDDYLYYADSDDNNYKLNFYNGKKSVTVDDEVYEHYYLSSDKIFFLTDYESGDGATLKLWTGDKDGSVEIDDDVYHIVDVEVVAKK